MPHNARAFVVVHMSQEHCQDQGGLVVVVDLARIDKAQFPLQPGDQIFFINPKLDGASGGQVVYIFDDEANKILSQHLTDSEFPSYV